MPQISVCMIVKDEARVLERCLESLKGLWDELIVVDTGSKDSTKEIALRYTNQVFDFVWQDDFAKARNFSFSKATKDYIYVADADEIIDAGNKDKFKKLKEVLLPEIEVVQMYYTNQLEYGTTYNYDKELRPKLFKRLRTFHWKDPIHETVEDFPVVYDSDIEIIHKPECSHAQRDFQAYQKVIKKGILLSEKLVRLYAKELFISDSTEDIKEAYPYFLSLLEAETYPGSLNEILCVVLYAARVLNNMQVLFKYGLHSVTVNNTPSEICYQLGEYFFETADWKEAALWFYQAAYQTESILNIHMGGDYAITRLKECYMEMGQFSLARDYETALQSWQREWEQIK